MRQNLIQKRGPNLRQNFADDLKIQTWPVFNKASPFCKLWIKKDVSLQKLLIGKRKCHNSDDDAVDDDADGDMIPLCLPFFAGDT